MPAPALRKQVEDVSRSREVRAALKQAAIHKPPAPRPRLGPGQLLGLAAAILAVVALALLQYALRFHSFGIAEKYQPLARRLSLAALGVTLTLALLQAVRLWVIDRIEDEATRYNMRRIARLLAGLAIAIIGLSLVFATWYTAFVSLGLISVVLGFALQTPITSFIGWIYILGKRPYRVGDRIEIGGATGDVIDVSYLDTTLWEFGGKYLSTDHPSGRIIKFPNSNVLSTPVYNYSWPLFPYIWNELSFQIAYSSDLGFVARTLQSIAEAEIGEEMMTQVRVFKEILAQTPVDQLEVNERPTVFFRINPNTWVEAYVRYLVHPKAAAQVKTRLLTRALGALNQQPERVLFPNGNGR